ncbi:MAG: SurA N-terminal domain-containing protein [Candidatus Omnitrophota bacterium]|nr:SurA N-terminal domain-containing protein [Candidatus Omnitrophota bacterium]
MFNFRALSLTAVILSIFSVSGCGRSGDLQEGDNKVIAKINNYKLTAADFRSEAKASLGSNISGSDFETAKEGLLDSIIIRKLLIQEAQKQNFDKDRAFTEEIERYWEQALLKLLYRKKSQEFLREISRDERDPQIRDKKVQQAFGAWMEDLKKNADIKKYEDNLRSVER